MAEDFLEIRFGVKGGSSITKTGSSGLDILNTLNGIVNNINKKPFGLMFGVSDDAIKNIQKTFENKINVQVGIGGTQHTAKELEKFKKTISSVDSYTKQLRQAKLFVSQNAEISEAIKQYDELTKKIEKTKSTISGLNKLALKGGENGAQAKAYSEKLSENLTVSESELKALESKIGLDIRNTISNLNKFVGTNSGAAVFNLTDLVDLDEAGLISKFTESISTAYKTAQDAIEQSENVAGASEMRNALSKAAAEPVPLKFAVDELSLTEVKTRIKDELSNIVNVGEIIGGDISTLAQNLSAAMQQLNNGAIASAPASINVVADADSYQALRQSIDALVSQINTEPFHLRFEVDEASYTDALNKLTGLSQNTITFKMEGLEDIADEGSKIDSINEKLQEHIKLVDQADTAEINKGQTSLELADILSDEARAVKDATDAMQSAQKASAEYIESEKARQEIAKSGQEEAKQREAEYQAEKARSDAESAALKLKKAQSKEQKPDNSQKKIIDQFKQIRNVVDSAKNKNIDKIYSLEGAIPGVENYRKKIIALQNTLENKGISGLDFDSLYRGDTKLSDQQIASLNGLKALYQEILVLETEILNGHQVSKKNATAELSYDKLINKLTTYHQKIRQTMDSDPVLLSEYNQLLEQLRSQAYGAGKDGATAAARAVQEFQIRVAQAGKDVETFGQKLKRAFGDKMFYGFMASLTAYMRRLVIEAYNNVREIDAAMTELRKVTDETESTYDRFLSNTTKRAKMLGATLTDIINASADFARLGYNLHDASTLADVAIVYKNVGDGIEDINTASESIISTMKAFGIAASNSMSIVDKFNITGNKFAISSGGVGEALLRSASAMAAANNTLDETIALATAANTVVQDPDKVGTSLKTISMYLRAAKTEAEEAGESTDGMASSVSELRSEILALTGNKVDIQAGDEFKSTYQIIKELSSVWGELSDISQANILEMIGGKRNANITAALIEGFDTAEEVLATTSDAAGSALEENEKYLDSINGKISKLSASLQSLSSNVLGAEWVKGGIDILTILVDMADKVAEINALLPITLGLFASFKTVGRPEYEGFCECAHVSSGGDAERVYAVIVA